jgi:gluconolactonase
MKTKTILTIIGCLIASALITGSIAQAQTPAETAAAGIAGVVAAGTPVELIWTTLTDSADGIVGAPDGSLLFAQEPVSKISRIDADGRVTSYMENTNGTGALALDAAGRIFACQRHEVAVGILSPEPQILTDNFQGEPLFGANDLVVDRKGGVYFTESGRMPFPGVYYISPAASMTSLGTDIRANGIMLSGDERTLYVTNAQTILAFDVLPDGMVNNRRTFGTVEGGSNVRADGLAIDAMGRVYAASQIGVQIFSPQGEHLGLIPVPRPTTSVAFAGAEKQTLYMTARGAEGATPEQRNARSMYKVSMLAEGFAGRAK